MFGNNAEVKLFYVFNTMVTKKTQGISSNSFVLALNRKFSDFFPSAFSEIQLEIFDLLCSRFPAVIRCPRKDIEISY